MNWDSYYALKRNTDNADRRRSGCCCVCCLQNSWLVVREQGLPKHFEQVASFWRVQQQEPLSEHAMTSRCFGRRSSCGLRYNSTLHYVQMARTMTHRGMAMVISEASPIGIFPDLSLQIKNGYVYERLAALKTPITSNLVHRREFNRCMDWFQQHGFFFFLWYEICAEINAIWQCIEPKLEATRMVINCPEFTPTPELEDSYCSDEQE